MMKMLVFYSILLLVVSPDLGYSISDDPEVSGSGFFLYSCLALGGSCIPKGTAKSFSGGTTTRCFGPRECRDGFTCCSETEYIAKRSTSEKKRRRQKRQAVTLAPGRAIKCPSADADPKCGTPDEFNPEGGLCRIKCKAGVNLAEIEKPDNDVCPAGNGCKCCFRQRECKKLRACTEQKGACRDQCLDKETPMAKGCKNGCTCCVPDDLVIDNNLPSCKDAGGRCTKSKNTCNAGENLVDDQYSCAPSPKGFSKKCCLKDPSDLGTFTCKTEGFKCKKKKCNTEIGQRDMSDMYPCGTSKKAKKKQCCLKDCFHWRSDTWFAHGERHLFECEWAVCYNGKYTTYGQERSEKCCEDLENSKYYEEFSVKCEEVSNLTLEKYSQICQNGSWVNQTELDPSCTESPPEPATPEPETIIARSEDNNGENVESDVESEEENHQAEEQSNESNQGDPLKGETKGTGKKMWKGKKTWKGKKKVTGEKKVIGSSPGVIKKGKKGKWAKGKKKVIGKEIAEEPNNTDEK